MTWSLTIVALVIAAFVCGYREHTRESRRLDRVLKSFARSHGGDFTRKKLLAPPRFRFERDGRNAWIGAIAPSGPAAGPEAFTYLDLELPRDTGRHLRIERNASTTDHGDHIADMVFAKHSPGTGDERFDRAFQVTGPDHAEAANLLDDDVRERLLASPDPQLDLHVAGPTISVHRAGVASSQDDLEEMMAVASLVAARC